MATITVEFNGDATDLNDFCTTAGYHDTVTNPDYDPEVEGSEATITNPETKVAFFQRKVKEYAWNTVKGYRLRQAQDAAIENVADVSF